MRADSQIQTLATSDIDLEQFRDPFGRFAATVTAPLVFATQDDDDDEWDDDDEDYDDDDEDYDDWDDDDDDEDE